MKTHTDTQRGNKGKRGKEGRKERGRKDIRVNTNTKRIHVLKREDWNDRTEEDSKTDHQSINTEKHRQSNRPIRAMEQL